MPGSRDQGHIAGDGDFERVRESEGMMERVGEWIADPTSERMLVLTEEM